MMSPTLTQNGGSEGMLDLNDSFISDESRIEGVFEVNRGGDGSRVDDEVLNHFFFLKGGNEERFKEGNEGMS